MPDYGFWSWPEPHIGTLDEVKEKVDKVEDKFKSWSEKIDKAVWRGTVHWNQGLRGRLLEISRGKSWSDMQELKWGENDLTMQESCQYKYLIYTEGVTYSGRLRYLQLCRSVIISTPIRWQTHLSPFMASSGPNQNVVLVNEDWSDLEATISRLQDNPLEAERIANNTIGTFKERYAADGAQTCYWRELFRSWAGVTDHVGDIAIGERGTRWESVLLMGSLTWDETAQIGRWHFSRVERSKHTLVRPFH